MRTIHWVCAISAALVAALLMAHQAGTPAPKKITLEELTKLLDQPEKVLFIDVREPNEIEVTGTLKGALTIPVGQLEERLKEVPKDKPVVAFCRSGKRATRAAALLDDKGYKTEGVFGLEEYRDQLKDYIVYPK
jgi:rhodanese-related sulfurtransferase